MTNATDNQPPETSVSIDADCSGVTYGIGWSQQLEPLGSPDDYLDKPWPLDGHIQRLYERCDALLRRCEEQERLIVNMMRK